LEWQTVPSGQSAWLNAFTQFKLLLPVSVGYGDSGNFRKVGETFSNM